MNSADPREGPFGIYGPNWIGTPDIDSRVARMDEPWWPFTGSHASWATSTTAQPGVIQHLNGSGMLSPASITTTVTTPTATSVGSNLTLGTAFSGTSTISFAGDSRPAPEPLEVRRFYHWNKSATAGAAAIRDTAGGPGAPLKGNIASVQATMSAAVQVMEELALKAMEERAVQTRDNRHRRSNRRRLVGGMVLSPRSLTSVAAILAGQKRSMVSIEWQGHLLGEAERGLTQHEQIRAARGFVLAAVRYRLQDAADQAWRPVDAVLRSHTWSNLFVLIPTAWAAQFIYRYEGTLGVIKSAESISAIGLVLFGLVHAGRRHRGVKPPKPKARSVMHKE